MIMQTGNPEGNIISSVRPYSRIDSSHCLYLCVLTVWRWDWQRDIQKETGVGVWGRTFVFSCRSGWLTVHAGVKGKNAVPLKHIGVWEHFLFWIPYFSNTQWAHAPEQWAAASAASKEQFWGCVPCSKEPQMWRRGRCCSFTNPCAFSFCRSWVLNCGPFGIKLASLASWPPVPPKRENQDSMKKPRKSDKEKEIEGEER